MGEGGRLHPSHPPPYGPDLGSFKTVLTWKGSLLACQQANLWEFAGFIIAQTGEADEKNGVILQVHT